MAKTISEQLAIDFGERRGRSVSRVLGDGISKLSGNRISGETGKDIVHLLMVAGLAAGASGRTSWKSVAGWSAFAGLVLGESGQSEDSLADS